MNKRQIVASLNEIANELENQEIKNELQNISLKLAGRFTRINPRFNKLRSPSFIGSDEYYDKLFRSIFINFQKNEDLPKDFFVYIFQDIKFGRLVKRFVEENNLQEVYAKMFEVYEDHIQVLLDKLISSKIHSFDMRNKIEYLEKTVFEYLTPTLKSYLKASLEVLEGERESILDIFNASRIGETPEPPSWYSHPIVKESYEARIKKQTDEAMREITSKIKILKSLENIANEFDNNKLYRQANSITKVMIKLADEFNIEENLDENLLDRRFNLNDFKNKFKSKSNRIEIQGMYKLFDMVENPTVKDAIDTIYDRLSNKYKKYKFDSVKWELNDETNWGMSNMVSMYWDTIGVLLGSLKEQDIIKTKEEYKNIHDYARNKFKEPNVKSMF